MKIQCTYIKKEMIRKNVILPDHSLLARYNIYKTPNRKFNNIIRINTDTNSSNTLESVKKLIDRNTKNKLSFDEKTNLKNYYSYDMNKTNNNFLKKEKTKLKLRAASSLKNKNIILSNYFDKGTNYIYSNIFKNNNNNLSDKNFFNQKLINIKEKERINFNQRKINTYKNIPDLPTQRKNIPKHEIIVAQSTNVQINNTIKDNILDMNINDIKKMSKSIFDLKNSKTKKKYVLYQIDDNTDNKSIELFEKENVKKFNTESVKNNQSNNMSLLKDVTKYEISININNLKSIIKKHISLEKEIINIINNKSIKNNKLKEDEYTVLINKLNEFFNALNEISFRIIIFVEDEYNKFLEQIIELLICYYCLVFIVLIFYNEDENFLDKKQSFLFFINKFSDVLKNISGIFYNICMKLIFTDLNKNILKDLENEIQFINIFFTKNISYNIINNNNINNIFNLLKYSYNSCYKKFQKCTLYIEKNFDHIYEITKLIETMESTISTKNILFFIDLSLNVLLYSILNINIKKAKITFNSSFNFSKIYAKHSVPFLPEIDSKFKYTLVLDMDETLGHFISKEISNNVKYNHYLLSKNAFDETTEIGIFLLRPHLKYFLEELSKFYEIVLFTAGTREYCHKIINIIDYNNNFIKYRLCRSHVSLRNIDINVKDLSLLGRDLKKTIIIDNCADNYKLQENNGLPISSWIGDINDTQLKDLVPLLKKIVVNKIDDVRIIVKKIKKQIKYRNQDFENIQYSAINLDNYNFLDLS